MPATISEAVVQRVAVQEASPFAEAASPASGPGRLLIRLINAGRGSSGVYTPEVLKAAAEARVFRKGTRMHIDHQTEQEVYERPEGSLHDLAAVLDEDARWDEASQALVAEARVYSWFRQMLAEMASDIGVSIRAWANTVPGEWNGEPAQVVTQLLEANTVDFVTAAGRGGAILQVLEAARPVREARTAGQWIESKIHQQFTNLADDLAADGHLSREERIALSGAIGDALAAFVAKVESDAPQLYTRDVWDNPPDRAHAASEAARGHGVAEAAVNDMRDRLQDLVAQAYRVEDQQYAWVRDFDDSTVWFEMSGTKANGTFQQAYTSDADGMPSELTGDPVEVQVRTEYVPVGEAAAPAPATPAVEAPATERTATAPPAPTNVPVNPAGQSTTQESEEDTMPQIEEARLRQLEEAHGRVPALESELAAAKAQAEESKQRAMQAEAATYARDFARNLVTKANGDLAEASVARIVGDATRAALPLLESGRLDTEQFTPLVEKARQDEEAYLSQVAEASGIGSVRGVGPTVGAKVVATEADFERAVARAFGHTPVKEA